MKYIIHDWYDPECIKILSHCRKGIRPGGRLLVVDQVVPAGNEPALSKIVDLEMLVLPGGMERTEKEFRELFAASGFRLERMIPTPDSACASSKAYRCKTCRTRIFFGRRWSWLGKPNAGGRSRSARWSSSTAA